METRGQTLRMHYRQYLSLYLAVRCGCAYRAKGESKTFFTTHTCGIQNLLIWLEAMDRNESISISSGVCISDSFHILPHPHIPWPDKNQVVFCLRNLYTFSVIQLYICNRNTKLLFASMLLLFGIMMCYSLTDSLSSFGHLVAVPARAVRVWLLHLRVELPAAAEVVDGLECQSGLVSWEIQRQVNYKDITEKERESVLTTVPNLDSITTKWWFCVSIATHIFYMSSSIITGSSPKKKKKKFCSTVPYSAATLNNSII